MEGNQLEIYDMVESQNKQIQDEKNLQAIGVSSQTGRIVAYLKAGNSLTGLEALKIFGTMKLSTRLSEAKRYMNIDIKSEMISTPSGKRVARYWIER